MGKYRKMTIKMTYEVIILGHLHMPLYFIGTFTEYPYGKAGQYRDSKREISGTDASSGLSPEKDPAKPLSGFFQNFSLHSPPRSGLRNALRYAP